MKLQRLGWSCSRALPCDNAPYPHVCGWQRNQPRKRDGRRAFSDRIRLNFYDQTIQKYAELPIHRLTIHELMSSGHKVNNERLIAIAQHVQRELCIRLARRLLDIQTLPYIVVENPHIQSVHAIYHRAFAKLVDFPKVVNINQDEQFVLLLKELVQEGVQVVPLLARGIYEASLRVSTERLNCNKFLADMIMSRISRRVIAEQFIALHHHQPGYVGVICKELSPLKVLEHVAPEAQNICQRTYGISPKYVVEGDTSILCSYIPTHLEYIIFELLKNAMRAVCERHLMNKDGLPPIKFLLARGPSDMTIRISDEGGGVPREFVNKIFDFGFSTCNQENRLDDEFDTAGLGMVDRAVLETSPMAGLGFGLPVSRLYAQYFGGDVKLYSVEGHGCDTYVRLDHIGDVEEFEEYDGFDIWRSLKKPYLDKDKTTFGTKASSASRREEQQGSPG
ncbi:hypothetical protein GUITHDRAFT_155357 [Guillardia theta CCMP2712]|uniref:Protein-serine/threonine kinase n=2 Tax=Guillardia theta TaxID=55529 RepID=L1IIA2_GUITC|nr:hypothetical protein GUITHDRAFT_155357 [Guillardia theta CCMP2712]EKX35983.1 hypothetical protein GUITHDRAFT_155357 [Guillardia theta CCMP2712]|mmetsp:Transcript_31561/g.100949  ORF Transcript_31561/g.100949 Transcript_31561/m.100949 type:complete len:449 (+) Transcript_31561:301-1647(+)|eukprot:XP_005822963.1 hypothetical protein GUITHDRAFT_155357 [Guillardia theta CCMP2712]